MIVKAGQQLCIISGRIYVITAWVDIESDAELEEDSEEESEGLFNEFDGLSIMLLPMFAAIRVCIAVRGCVVGETG